MKLSFKSCGGGVAGICNCGVVLEGVLGIGIGLVDKEDLELGVELLPNDGAEEGGSNVEVFDKVEIPSRLEGTGTCRA